MSKRFTAGVFQNNNIFMPVTVKQFEDLTNEILGELNKLPEQDEKGTGFSSDYVAQILTSSLHGYETKDGFVSKAKLFGMCIKRISNHVTYHITSGIQEKLKAANGASEEQVNENDEDETVVTAGAADFSGVAVEDAAH